MQPEKHPPVWQSKRFLKTLTLAHAARIVFLKIIGGKQR